MAGIVYGVYDNHEQVMEAIHKLKARGFKSKDLTVMADKKDRLQMERKEKVNLSFLEDEEMNTFFQALQKLFFFGKKQDVLEKLSSLSLTKEEMDVYIEQIMKGKILLVLDPVDKDDDSGPAIKENKREFNPMKPLGNIQWSLYKKE
ncbi:MAG: general stress protein [Bacillus sp. (in: firmicutes)]